MVSISDKISAAAHDFWPDTAYPIPITKHWYGKPCVDPRSNPTFDPMLGFPNGRKEREMHFTQDEMVDFGVPMRNRDYCVHKYLDYMNCFDETTFASKLFKKSCDGVWQKYSDCKFDIVVMQAKEYEREKRLLARQKRRIAMGLESDPGPQPRQQPFMPQPRQTST